MSTPEKALSEHTLNSESAEVYDDGYLRVEHQNYYVTCRGEPIYLARTEFLLLSRLVRSIKRVVTSEDLWRYAWEHGKPFNAESLHVHIYRLRGKLLPYNLRIDNMVNVGYRFLPNRGGSQHEHHER